MNTYLSPDVTPEEFTQLKSLEGTLIAEAALTSRSDGLVNSAVLKYNHGRRMVGIFIQGRLCVYSDSNDRNTKFLDSLYSGMQTSLELLRLSQDDWVESVESPRIGSPVRLDKPEDGDNTLPF